MCRWGRLGYPGRVSDFKRNFKKRKINFVKGSNVRIKRCTTFWQNVLKMLKLPWNFFLHVQQSQEQKRPRKHSNNYFLINQAQIQYLQDEYASILVNSHFDSTTLKLFRAMKKNNFGLNASSLDMIQSAASLSAAAKSPPTRHYSGFSNRWYYRGGSRGGYITTWPDRTRSIVSSADSSVPREDRATVHRSKTHWMWLHMRYVRENLSVWVL